MSRPKKRVAIVDAAEISRNVRSCVVDVWGYQPIAVATARQAALLARRERIDVILAVLPKKSDWRSLKRAKRLNPDLTVLSLDPKAGARGSYAEISLGVKCSAVELRESLRSLARR